MRSRDLIGSLRRSERWPRHIYRSPSHRRERDQVAAAKGRNSSSATYLSDRDSADLDWDGPVRVTETTAHHHTRSPMCAAMGVSQAIDRLFCAQSSLVLDHSRTRWQLTSHGAY